MSLRTLYACLALGLITAATAVDTTAPTISKARTWATTSTYGGQQPTWRLTFTASIVGNSSNLAFNEPIVAGAQTGIRAAAKAAGVSSTAPPSLAVSADRQQLYVTVNGASKDQSALTTLQSRITASGSAPAGLLGPSLPRNAFTISNAAVMWVCKEGQTLCLGMCVDAGTVTVNVMARGRYLSVTAAASDVAVGSYETDNSSGRQRWVLTPSGAGAGSYEIQVAGGKEGKVTALGASTNSTLQLLSSESSNGCRRWHFTQTGANLYKITCSAGLKDMAKNVLTMDAEGRTMLWYSLSDPAKAAVAQRFTVKATAAVSSVVVAASTQVTKRAVVKKGALVLLGGAYATGLVDLAKNPSAWATAAKSTGYWLHPMGMVEVWHRKLLSTLLADFGKRQFVYEMDLYDSTSSSNPIALSAASYWGNVVRAASRMSCTFYAPWVAGDKLANSLGDVVARYRKLVNRMAASGYRTGYLFYAPPSPEALLNANTLLNKKYNGMSYVEFVVRSAGLKGIVLDYPASLLLSRTLPAQYGANAGDNARAMAKQAHDICRKLNIPFGWVFNGAEVSVKAAMDAITGLGMRVDYWAIDNFASPSRRGTPETDANTMSGQALNAVNWLKGSSSGVVTVQNTTVCEPFKMFT